MYLFDLLNGHPKIKQEKSHFGYPGFRGLPFYFKEVPTNKVGCTTTVFQGPLFFDQSVDYYKETNPKVLPRLPPLKKYFDVFGRIENFILSPDITWREFPESSLLGLMYCANYTPKDCKKIDHLKCYVATHWEVFQNMVNFGELPAKDVIELFELNMIPDTERIVITPDFAEQIKTILEAR